ncbi:hypothetical protein D3C84_795290 [compost metagenome]
MNQTEPSRLHTMSLGEFSGLPSKLSASTVIVPLCSVRVMRRPSLDVVEPSHTSNRPWRSRHMPLEKLEFSRYTDRLPVISSQRTIRLLGMSLTSR